MLFLYRVLCSVLYLVLNMSLSKRRIVHTECCVFNEKWNNDYFFIEQNNFALCVICKENVAVDILKPSTHLHITSYLVNYDQTSLKF